MTNLFCWVWGHTSILSWTRSHEYTDDNGKRMRKDIYSPKCLRCGHIDEEAESKITEI